MSGNNSRLVQNARAALALLGLSGVLTACAEPVERRDRGAFIGNQGAAWEAIYPLPSVDGRGIEAAAGPEAWRRDAALGADDSSYTPRGTWITDDRPRLEDIRWLYLRPRPDAVYFYDSRP